MTAKWNQLPFEGKSTLKCTIYSMQGVCKYERSKESIKKIGSKNSMNQKFFI